MPIIETKRIIFPEPATVDEFKNLLQALSASGITLTKEQTILEGQLKAEKYFLELDGFNTYILSFHNGECFFIKKGDHEKRISFEQFCKSVSCSFVVSPFKDSSSGCYNYFVTKKPLGLADYFFYLMLTITLLLITLLVFAAVSAIFL